MCRICSGEVPPQAPLSAHLLQQILQDPQLHVLMPTMEPSTSQKYASPLIDVRKSQGIIYRRLPLVYIYGARVMLDMKD